VKPVALGAIVNERAFIESVDDDKSLGRFI
jgi:hypothetical protein